MSYAIVDVETVGFVPLVGPCPGMLSIAVHVLDRDLTTVDRKVWKVAVAASSIDAASPRALEVNGYTPEDWADAQPLAAVLAEVSAMVDGCHFVAHNVTFDWQWFTAAYAAAGMRVPNVKQKICTMSMLIPLKLRGVIDSASLNAGADWVGVARDEVHEAGQDVDVAAEILRAMVDR